MASISIKVFQGKEGFHKIKNDWNRIVDTLKDKHLIHLYEWYKSYIDTVDDNDFNAIFLVMYRNSEPFAIFPIEEHVKNIVGFKFRILQVPHCNDIDMVDFIFEKKNDTEKLMELLIDNLEKYLNHKWDCIYFPNVLENSSIYFSLQKSPINRVTVDKVGECHYLQCGSYETLSNTFSGNFRNQLKKKRNRLSRLGNFEYISIRKKDTIKKAFDDFLEIEASGWKGAIGTAIKPRSKIKRFYENLIDNFSDNDKCEINFLKINNEIVAGSFHLLTDNTFYLLKTGYDNKYSKVSPGVLLQDSVIKKYSNDPAFKTINMISDYKWGISWNPLSMDVFNIIVFNKSVSGLIYYYLIDFLAIKYRRYIKPMLSKYEKHVKRIKKNERTMLNVD